MTWVDGTDPAIAVAIAQAYNNWLYDFMAKDPVRLKGIAILPVQDMQETVAEFRRAVKDLGMVGGFVRPNPMDGRTLGDPYYDPLWTVASELGVPIMVHEAAATTLNQIGRGRISTFGRHIACHPMEQALACLNFCGDGVLARFPDLKVAFMESGCGWLPFWLERMDEHWKHSTFGANRAIPKAPSEYFASQCFISSEGEEKMIPVVADLVGDHVIVTASDYPHPDELCMTDIHTREDISDHLRRKIFFDNPVRLYNLNTDELEASAV
jgi:predicted TIM-barrel fold metal-dependent hydrolase